MPDIYTQLAAVAAQMLAPTSQGGMGQGQIVLTHSVPGAPNPATPWEPVEPTVTTETLKGAARGVDARIVGTEVGGTVVLASDKQVTCAPPTIAYTPGDTLTIDGVPMHIIAVEKKPAAGTTVAVKFLVRA